jgi:hypothetical protein
MIMALDNDGDDGSLVVLVSNAVTAAISEGWYLA